MNPEASNEQTQPAAMRGLPRRRAPMPPIGNTPAAEVMMALHDALDRRLLEEQKHGSPHWMAFITICLLITAILANFVWDAGAFTFYWMLVLPVPPLVIYVHMVVEERRRRMPIAEILGLLTRIEAGDRISPSEVQHWIEESAAHHRGAHA